MTRARSSTSVGATIAILVAAAGCGSSSTPPAGAASTTGAQDAAPVAVTALGRLEPKDGIFRIAGPSRFSVVIAKLLVDEGSWVDAGKPVALLDTIAENQARVTRLRAELANAEADLARWAELFRLGTAATSSRDAAQLKVDVARAELGAAQAALDQDTVRAPVSGQILKVHARSGEKVGPEGIAEIAQNDRMYAVAEVYETDIGRVRVGQRAVIRSPTLEPELVGTVEVVGLKVGRLEALDPDPSARTDARIVEVRIKLDDSARAAGLTNLQVEVAIQPG
jgi:HlyD family secretion protein